jgi:hypothetical protein
MLVMPSAKTERMQVTNGCRLAGGALCRWMGAVKYCNCTALHCTVYNLSYSDEARRNEGSGKKREMKSFLVVVFEFFRGRWRPCSSTGDKI